MLKDENKEISTLTSKDVENLTLSIRLYPDRLNFIISDENSDHIKHCGYLIFEKKISYINDITDVLFDNGFLRLNYKKVLVYVNPSKWCVIPADLYDEEKAHLWIRSITEYNTETKNSKVLAHKMLEEGKVLIYDINKDVLDLINRTLSNVEIKPYIAKAIGNTRRMKINFNNKINCLSLNSQSIDFISFNKGSIDKCCNFLFTDIKNKNSFIDEIVYFIANIYSSNIFDLNNDYIIICYNENISSNIDFDILTMRLKSYSKNIILHTTDI